MRIPPDTVREDFRTHSKDSERQTRSLHARSLDQIVESLRTAEKAQIEAHGLGAQKLGDRNPRRRRLPHRGRPFRSDEDGIRISSRYFATVRLAIVVPWYERTWPI